MNKPLEGLFVVELTTYWAAPSAGEFLRCLGARVVKIETGSPSSSHAQKTTKMRESDE